MTEFKLPAELQFNLKTGATGCGKTTLAKLTCKYLSNDTPKFGRPRMTFRDTSKCLEDSKLRKTPAGLALIAQDADRLAGKILKAEPVFESVMENITWIPGYMDLKTFLLAGSPRTPQEWALYLKKFGKSHLHVFHILCKPEQIQRAIEHRILSGEIREDDGPRTLATKLLEYKEKVLPAVALVPKGILTEIPYEMPLTEKLELYVMKMRIAENVRVRMLKKIGTRSHPVHEAIRNILAPKPPQNRPALERVMFFSETGGMRVAA
jgi:adenylate kinase family enzyme